MVYNVAKDVAQVSDDAGDDDDDERERGFNSKKRRVDTRVDALALLAKDSKKKKSKKKNKSKGNGSEEVCTVLSGQEPLSWYYMRCTIL